MTRENAAIARFSICAGKKLFVDKLQDMYCNNGTAKSHTRATGKLFRQEAVRMMENINEAFDNKKTSGDKSNNINGNRVKVTTSRYTFVGFKLNGCGEISSYR